MVDRAAVTLVPPPPTQRDIEEDHKNLALELASHPDPKVRILAHISTRQFELSERLVEFKKEMIDGFAGVQSKMDQKFRDLGDRIAALDNGFVDIEERTSELEKRPYTNGSSSQPERTQ